MTEDITAYESAFPPGSSGRPAGARVEGEVGDTTSSRIVAPSTAPEPAPEVEETAGGSISPIAPPETTTEVDRVEVIGNTGRLLVKRPVSDVVLSLQDSGRTLKVFLTEPEETAEAVERTLRDEARLILEGVGMILDRLPPAARPSPLREDITASPEEWVRAPHLDRWDERAWMLNTAGPKTRVVRIPEAVEQAIRAEVEQAWADDHHAWTPYIARLEARAERAEAERDRLREALQKRDSALKSIVDTFYSDSRPMGHVARSMMALANAALAGESTGAGEGE